MPKEAYPCERCGEPVYLWPSWAAQRKTITHPECRPTTQERFWEKVDKDAAPAGCWRWTSADRNGYPAVTIDGEVRYAHRVAYEWEYGEIPDGMWISHTCGTTMCVRPDHLIATTPKENRAMSGRVTTSGDDNPNAILTQVAVDRFRERFLTGETTIETFADEQGIAIGTARAVAGNHAWHDPDYEPDFALARFWRWVDRRDPDDCWPWTGPVVAQNGYPFFVINGVKTTAARFMYRLTYGDPGDRNVLHTCKNQVCVNPDHLETRGA